MQDMNLLNNDSETADYTLVGNEVLGEHGNKETKYYSDNKLFVIYEITRGKIRNTEYQTELPMSSLHWIANTIQNGFWRLPSEGGLPKDKHSITATFDNEEILLGRSMNAGEYGKPGFKIVNKGRSSHILASRPQEFQITDERVQNVLLPLIAKLGIS